ncbi:MAG: hypothetical protein JXJ20_15585 [Anaerolineae bacterium]|jgi:hypothetical protein|nr:hypothetical protein [Anaerolineae bacterium]
MSNRVPTLAFNLEHDVQALAAMASNLTPYLYEKEMYGYLSNDLPKLTLGGLLLRLYRLSHLEESLNAEQQNLVQNARINFEAAASEWAVHYEGKLQHELQVRIDVLSRFLNECGDDLQSCAAYYPVQAEKRTMIEHLRDEAREHDCLSEELDAQLQQVDNRLRRTVDDGDFIFDDRLQDVYPRSRFWWLYAHVPEDSGRR